MSNTTTLQVFFLTLAISIVSGVIAVLAIDASIFDSEINKIFEILGVVQEQQIIESTTRFDWSKNTEFLHFMDDNFVTERELSEALEGLK